MNLSPKEKSVFTYIAMGYTDKEIGLKMKISYSTVRSHVDRGILKMSAKNRTHATLKFLFTLKPEAYARKIKEIKKSL